MASGLVDIAQRLRRRVDALSFSAPAAFVYNPLDYAWAPHRHYLEQWGQGPKEAMFVGMNPGPFGMAQNGVPFGATTPVRDFLGIRGAVGKPPEEHPKRPIEGLGFAREEVSGSRLWGWVESRWGAPEPFFARFFVHNYCPLLFLADTGRNLTPDKLAPGDRDALLPICDEALADAARALGVRRVFGVGAWAEARCKAALDGTLVGGEPVTIGRVLHPSPASPKANRGWAAEVEKELAAQGVAIP